MPDTCPLCKKEHVRSFEQALKVQSRTAGALGRLVRGLKAAELITPPAPGKWSIAELAWHLADCELVYGFRYRKLLAEDGAVLPAFDQNLWASETGYRDRDPKLAVETFAALRRANVGLLRAHAARRARTATHPEFGELSLGAMTVHLSTHDENHLGQIRRIRKMLARPTRG